MSLDADVSISQEISKSLIEIFVTGCGTSLDPNGGESWNPSDELAPV